ncbi:hypothetical protein C1H46_000066 [Malus baccata]|uniref:Uncharacterized protein n=1 Tax=Malus baccata TaxID=106549 RepID=A0A540NT14_MALBA|nr:hypothetical protein C1H46_000066 [Malus baccata]
MLLLLPSNLCPLQFQSPNKIYKLNQMEDLERESREREKERGERNVEEESETMTLKDFHGGSILSDLLLSSAPGVSGFCNCFDFRCPIAKDWKTLGCPSELADRPEDWEWFCNHFTDPKFVKKSIAGKIARESKTLLHHFGSKPFSYRLEARHEFPEIDLFKDVYVQPGDETNEQLHGAIVLQVVTSQFPPETPIEDITIPEDVGFEIMIEVLNQKFGRRHGKVVRGMGKARVRETGASSSRSTTGEVNALKEEVTTLKGQLVAQDKQIKAKSEQMKAKSEQLRAKNEQLG